MFSCVDPGRDGAGADPVQGCGTCRRTRLAVRGRALGEVRGAPDGKLRGGPARLAPPPIGVHYRYRPEGFECFFKHLRLVTR
ncbi:hypothetical protein BCEN4_1820007 [Burkholderia cenocepacia]|nr:hypothetical protein BCEN4_1820007 [Burkholderia cenocepacia]